MGTLQPFWTVPCHRDFQEGKLFASCFVLVFREFAYFAGWVFEFCMFLFSLGVPLTSQATQPSRGIQMHWVMDVFLNSPIGVVWVAFNGSDMLPVFLGEWNQSTKGENGVSLLQVAAICGPCRSILENSTSNDTPYSLKDQLVSLNRNVRLLGLNEWKPQNFFLEVGSLDFCPLLHSILYEDIETKKGSQHDASNFFFTSIRKNMEKHIFTHLPVSFFPHQTPQTSCL